MPNMGNELSRKLQPAQGTTAVVCMGAISAIAILYPDEVGNRIPHLTSFIHLASISTWFGIHFWVTFVAGMEDVLLFLCRCDIVCWLAGRHKYLGLPLFGTV